MPAGTTAAICRWAAAKSISEGRGEALLYPKLKKKRLTRSTIKNFYGYDSRLRPPEGAFTYTENLSCDHYPLMSSRKKRGWVKSLEKPQGLLARDALAIVEDGCLYYNGYATPLAGMREGEKQLVSMGAYICIFPDKLYYNTQDPSDHGSMEAVFDYGGRVEYSMCSSQGESYENVLFSAIAPESPDDGQLWADTRSGSLNRYSADSAMWVSMESVYTKLTFTTMGQLPELFGIHDGVSVSGAFHGALNGSKLIYAIGGSADGERDWLVLAGEPAENRIQENAEIRIERRVPDMDFVCQCQNRLWGCFYGNNGRENLNEVYACALGDFKNWNQFMGLSTDSWRAGCGSDGAWTGAVAYLGSPVFFKEESLTRAGVSPVGAHRLEEMVCRGVQAGSHKSLAVINETLFYKSRSDICAYQGAFPESVSAALGEERYFNAVGCGCGGKYCVSMEDGQGRWSYFVYDTRKGLWMREDELKAEFLACVDEELYCISEGQLYALMGSTGQKEKKVSWEAVTGLLCCSEPDSKYISRLSIRAAMEADAFMEVYIEYDSLGRWESAGRINVSRAGTAQLPLRLRRCDHIRLRLCGRGDVKILSLTREECAE